MSWFKRDKPIIELDDRTVSPASIEIIAHKNARQEVVQEAKLANEKLNKLLVENHFTLKIYLSSRRKTSHPKGAS